MTKAIEDLNFKSQGPPNLFLQQKSAIKSLKKKSKITIKAADEGGSLVIIEISQYETMCKDIKYCMVSTHFKNSFG